MSSAPTPEGSTPPWIPTPLYQALDRAAAYYRRGLKEIIEDCSHDRPSIDKIREHAERAISAADYEMEHASVPRLIQEERA